MSFPERTVRETKEGLKEAWFYCPLYRFRIYLVWGGSAKQLKKYMKREMDVPFDKIETDGRCIELLSDGSGWAHVIYVRDFKINPRWISVLGHECFHATEQILAQRSISFDSKKSNESFAYLLEYIMQECLDILMEKGGEK